MFADVHALHRALLEMDPRDFVSHFLFEPVPYAFGGNFFQWISWKTKLARHIEVDARDVVLTGSGAIGYSLNPKKKFRKFDSTSDIDCGVISPYHFEVAWRCLRQLRPAWLTLEPEARRAIVLHQKNYVFSGAIATDFILPLLPFGPTWQAGLDAMGAIEPTVGREVKLRIYKDYDSLRHYQARGIELLRNELLVAEGAETDIFTEE
ncbi:MAG TPA: hypothetical protein VKY31_15215 [Terriglobia bacterium]|nr:hypothetical protein [Terriglobia bacterium]